MKKLFVTLAFLAVSLISNAQFFVAGSVSASHSSSKTVYVNHETDYDPRYNGFSVTPAVGYMIPGKSYGFGLGLGYAYSSVKKDLSKDFTNTFDFGPFFRYAYARFDKITLYFDAKMPISVANAKTKIGDAVAIKGDKTFAIGGRLIPGLTYRFSDHILFTTEIGLLSINYNHTKTTSSTGNVIVKTDDFKLGANTRQIASFGFVYLF
jgi:hypothetical protein